MSRLLKGVVLAAGMGTRLRPITQEIPKAAVPLLGQPMLYYAIRHLVRVGINDIAINSFYAKAAIKDLVKQCPIPCQLKIFEEPHLLGTMGAYLPMDSWRDGHDLLVINCDVYAQTDLEMFIQLFYERHKAQPELQAGWLLDAGSDEASLVCLDSDQSVKAIHSKGASISDSGGRFTGIQILTDTFFKQAWQRTKEERARTRGILELTPYMREELIPRRRLLGIMKQEGDRFSDLGTIQDYWDTNYDLLKEHSALSHKDELLPCLISGDTSVDESACVENGVITAGRCQIGEQASVSRSILLDGAIIPKRAVIKHAIVGKDFAVQIK